MSLNDFIRKIDPFSDNIQEKLGVDFHSYFDFVLGKTFHLFCFFIIFMTLILLKRWLFKTSPENREIIINVNNMFFNSYIERFTGDQTVPNDD